MCGVVGIVGHSPVNLSLYDALIMLQHRGQDAAGMATICDQRLHLHKGKGLVRDLFDASAIEKLTGDMGIGQVRYPTAGTLSPAEAQPLYVNSPYGIALAHNGNLTNAAELSRVLFQSDLRHTNTNSDSEVLLNVFAHEMARCGKVSPDAEDVFQAVANVHKRCRGAYAVVAIVVGAGLVAFRDPNGVRPLVIGIRESEVGKEYAVASESVALDILLFDRLRDLAPGEAVYITERGEFYSKRCVEQTQLRPCIFEYVYLARPDSILDEISVYKTRLRAGEFLHRRVLEKFSGGRHDIDVVIPIPDTSRTAALPLAHRLNVKYREGFIKNRYIDRTFIMPDQQQRADSVRRKLNSIDLEFRDKSVLLVDDSIVRGTTAKQIIRMARGAGAKRVYLAAASPPVRYPNIYGIDMPSVGELIAANNRTDEEIADLIGADLLIYLRVEDLMQCGQAGNSSVERFECSIFDGKYLTDADKAFAKTRLKTRTTERTGKKDESAL